MAMTNEKAQLLALAHEALEASTSPESLLKPGQGGVATFNPGKDTQVQGLASFDDAVTALGALPALAAVVDSTERIVLQFIYDYLERQTGADFDERAFEDTWTSFLEELMRPDWRYLSTSYLQNYESDDHVFMLPDGVAIYHRESYDFDQWSDFEIEKLHDDWHAELHVIVAEDKVRKEPDNFILMGAGQALIKMQRMIRALRLTKEGDLVLGGGGLVGRVLSTRPVGSGFPPNAGASMTGFPSRWRFGSPYTLSVAEIPQVSAIYHLLQKTEGRPTAGYNLSLAIRFFESSYDRLPVQDDTRIVDLITAAEALVGTSLESSFRLAFRVAGILADSDEERVQIYTQIKRFYDARSKIVHGAGTDKVKSELSDYGSLRAIIRRLLVAFLHLTATPNPRFTRKYFAESRLDADLNSSVLRADVRRSMGLEQSN
jgi:hypothetical protein